MKKYKGGVFTQNSGGWGPDTYLFKSNKPKHHYVKVYIRKGAIYKKDLESLSKILQDCERVDRRTLQRKYMGKKLKSLSAHEFLMRDESNA